jgi:membrane-associated protease RseP (regulator of RpoE activity)
MENERQRLVAIVAAIAVAGLLLSCFAGALAGGLAGLLMGRHQAQIAVERALAEAPWPEAVPWPEELPIPMPEFPEATPFVQPQPGIEGAVVVGIIKGTAAEEAGLRPGDVIVAVDDVPIDRNHLLPDVLAQYQPGERIAIEFWRGGEQQAVRVTLGENPEDPALPYLGVRYRMNLEPDYNLPGG